MSKTRDQMLRDLAAEIPELDACVAEALRKYQSQYGPLRHEHSPRTQASIIHDLMVIEARARFGTRRGVNIIKKHGAVLLSFATGWLARFKKLSSSGTASFIATQTAMKFANQVPMSGIGQPATHLFVGYVLHPGSIAQSETYVVCPAGQKRAAWSHRVARPTATPVTLPTRQAAPAERKRVRVKAKARTIKADNGTDG